MNKFCPNFQEPTKILRKTFLFKKTFENLILHKPINRIKKCLKYGPNFQKPTKIVTKTFFFQKIFGTSSENFFDKNSIKFTFFPDFYNTKFAFISI